MCRLCWFLDPGGWSKTAVVSLYFIFPGICTLSLDCSLKKRAGPLWFLDPGGWSKTAAVRLFFIFPGICTLSLIYHRLQFIEESSFALRPLRFSKTMDPDIILHSSLARHPHSPGDSTCHQKQYGLSSSMTLGINIVSSG
ncbi:hypothetical protein STEG23_032260 [Scotinomys teguina]